MCVREVGFPKPYSQAPPTPNFVTSMNALWSGPHVMSHMYPRRLRMHEGHLWKSPANLARLSSRVFNIAASQQVVALPSLSNSWGHLFFSMVSPSSSKGFGGPLYAQFIQLPRSFLEHCPYHTHWAADDCKISCQKGTALKIRRTEKKFRQGRGLLSRCFKEI